MIYFVFLLKQLKIYTKPEHFMWYTSANISACNIINCLQIKLENDKDDHKYEFLYHDWVTVTEEEDGWTEIPVQDPDENNILPGTEMFVWI